MQPSKRITDPVFVDGACVFANSQITFLAGTAKRYASVSALKVSLPLLVIANMLCACATPQQPASASADSAVAAAQPTSTSNTPTAATAAASQSKDQIVCRNEQKTGTRFTKRVCKTRGDIAKETELARETMRAIDRKSSTGVGGESLNPN